MASLEEVKELCRRIRTSKARQMKVDGLQGSSAALLLATMKSRRGTFPNLLVIMNEADEAGYMYHDITQMLGDGSTPDAEGAHPQVLFFPSSYRRAIKYNQKDAANEILRTEVLTKTLEGPLLIVTYPDALAERVVSKQELDENTLTLKVGDLFDISQLEEDIFNLGFTRVDYVYEPGQFAVRGSIVDVYSFSSDIPYRIDFFGDEVDSIRTFDVQSQLSEGKVEAMTIVPSIKKDNTAYISFLEFLPQDTLIVTQSLAYVCEKIRLIHEEGFSSQAQFEASTNDETLVDQFIIDEETFKRQVVQFRQLEIKKGETHDEQAIHFHTSPQPLFHKNCVKNPLTDIGFDTCFV